MHTPELFTLVSRSKLKAAKVMNKLAEVRPPENYVEQEDVPVYEEPKAVPRYQHLEVMTP